MILHSPSLNHSIITIDFFSVTYIDQDYNELILILSKRCVGGTFSSIKFLDLEIINYWQSMWYDCIIIFLASSIWKCVHVRIRASWLLIQWRKEQKLYKSDLTSRNFGWGDKSITTKWDSISKVDSEIHKSLKELINHNGRSLCFLFLELH